MTADILVKTADLPWVEIGPDTRAKFLRVDPDTNTYTLLLLQAGGTEATPHRHLGEAEFYVIRGRIEYIGGVAEAGDFGVEPAGAVHEKTVFPEETLYIFTARGPIEFFAPDGTVARTVSAADFAEAA